MEKALTCHVNFEEKELSNYVCSPAVFLFITERKPKAYPYCAVSLLYSCYYAALLCFRLASRSLSGLSLNTPLFLIFAHFASSKKRHFLASIMVF